MDTKHVSEDKDIYFPLPYVPVNSVRVYYIGKTQNVRADIETIYFEI